MSDSTEDPEMAEASTTTESYGSRCGRCCKRFMAFLASTVGLTCLTAAYAIFGGYIFMLLEAPTKIQCHDVVVMTTMDASSQIMTSGNHVTTEDPYQSEFETDLNATMVNISVMISDPVLLQLHLDKLWNMTEQLNVLQYDVWKSLAKEILEIYTIGVYKSSEDRFKMVAGNTSTAENGSLSENTTIESRREEDCEILNEEEMWTFSESLLYAITVVTTIGYGHITPKTPCGMIVTIVYAIFGIPLTLFTIANLGRVMATAFRFIYKHIIRLLSRIPCPCRRPSKEVNDDKEEKEEKKEEKENEEKVKIPMIVTVLLLSGYIVIGSVLFGQWEGWDYVKASYFCFITLSTIGFGDYVPGIHNDAGASNEKLLCCAVYLLVGLSFICMCFDLIQEDAVHKIKQFGKFIGLISKDKDK